jgi:DNA (cytosine-5)-methyltransferase 1
VPAFALQHATVGGHEANGPRGKGWREDVAFTLDTVGTDVVAYAATDYESGAFDSVDAAGPLTTSADRTRAAPILAHAVALRGREGGGTAELGDDMAHALRASSGGGDKPHVLAAMQVRRLTPRECEKLQGFEPDYTLVPFGRPSKAKLDQDFLKYQLRGNPKHLKREDIDRLAADGPRYKALGNSWAVPCARWVGQRIQKVMEQANA